MPFVVQIVGIVGLVGYLSFQNGRETVDTLSKQLRSEITARIEERLETYLASPHQINRINLNAVLLGQLDPEDVPALEKHFWRQIDQFNEATYIYFGAPSSLFSGAGKENGRITLGYSKLDSLKQGFETYATNSFGDRQELLSVVPNYNVLERPWYTQAIANVDPTWGKPYVWAAPYPNLALPAVAAVYTPEFKGVFAVDLSLIDISKFLQTIKVGKTGQTFILERNGLLIANSGETTPFREVDEKQNRVLGTSSDDPLISNTTQYLVEHFGTLAQVKAQVDIRFKVAGQWQLVQVSPYRDEFGLDWLIVVVVPEADFMTQIYESAQQTILLCGVALVVALGIGILTSRWVLQPISNLNTVAQDLAQGNLQREIHSDRQDELGELTQAIAQMAKQLQESFQTLEERVEQRTGELEDSNQQLAQAKEKAEVANRAKSTFLAQMSHELRTPLNAILGFTQILRRSPDLDADQQENLEIMERSGEHLLGLINNVLDFSKIEAGKMGLDLEPINLAALLENVGTLFREQAVQKQLKLQVRYPENFPETVLVDAQKLRQILINLLSNSLKFTKTGSVSLSAENIAQTDQHVTVKLAIADTGAGISSLEQAKLFQPFQQSLSGREINGGTGLGLVISQSFAALMDSRILLDSKPGQGSTFCFTLTLDIVGQPAKSLAPEPAMVPITEQPLYKILIVDDSRINRLLFKKLFIASPFELAEAVNGQAAIAQWETWQPHLIFMDLLMPVMDGEEAIRAIRARPDGDQVKIIACTASLQTEIQQKLIAAGCDDFLSKPFRTKDVFKLLEKHLSVQLQAIEERSPQA